MQRLVCAPVPTWNAQVVELSIECTELGHVFISAVTDWLSDNLAMHHAIHCPIGDVINLVRIVDGTAMLCKISEFGDTEIQLCNIAGYTKLIWRSFLLMSSLCRFVAVIDLLHRMAAHARQSDLVTKRCCFPALATE